MAKKQYVDLEDITAVINKFNNDLSVKLEEADLANYATKDDLEDIDVDLTGYATQTYVNNKVAEIEEYDDTELAGRVTSLEGKATGLYHFKGSVENLAALEAIENPEVGDTYNLNDTGMNAAWDGEAWDEFGSTVDLSEYAKTEDIEAITLSEIYAILYNGKKATVSTLDTLQAMLNNDQAEVEITLNDDLTLTSTLIIPEGKKVTLNLEDNEISATGVIALAVNGGELVLNGGDISSNKTAVQVQNGGSLEINGSDISSTTGNGVNATGTNSELVINSGTVTAQEYGVGAYDGSEVTINGGSFTGLDNFALGGNGTAGKAAANVTINGGVFEGQIVSAGYIATGIYWPNDGTLTINGGVIRGAAGIVQRGGHVIINEGATIVANGATGVLGKAGDSKVTVGPYAVVFDLSAGYPYSEGMTLVVNDGASLTGTDGDICKLPADAEGVTDNRS